MYFLVRNYKIRHFPYREDCIKPLVPLWAEDRLTILPIPQHEPIHFHP